MLQADEINIIHRNCVCAVAEVGVRIRQKFKTKKYMSYMSNNMRIFLGWIKEYKRYTENSI
jgi:hypothetical protein